MFVNHNDPSKLFSKVGHDTFNMFKTLKDKDNYIKGHSNQVYMPKFNKNVKVETFNISNINKKIKQKSKLVR